VNQIECQLFDCNHKFNELFLRAVVANIKYPSKLSAFDNRNVKGVTKSWKKMCFSIGQKTSYPQDFEK